MLCCNVCPQLNGRSSVLRCNLGMALAKMGKPAEALAHMDEAIAADPANPLARFERAGVLLAQERYVDALAELETLRVGPLPLRSDSDRFTASSTIWF